MCSSSCAGGAVTCGPPGATPLAAVFLPSADGSGRDTTSEVFDTALALAVVVVFAALAVGGTGVPGAALVGGPLVPTAGLVCVPDGTAAGLAWVPAGMAAGVVGAGATVAGLTVAGAVVVAFAGAEAAGATVAGLAPTLASTVEDFAAEAGFTAAGFTAAGAGFAGGAAFTESPAVFAGVADASARALPAASTRPASRVIRTHARSAGACSRILVLIARASLLLLGGARGSGNRSRVQAVCRRLEGRRRGAVVVGLRVGHHAQIVDRDDPAHVRQLGQERADLVIAAAHRDLDRQLGVVGLGPRRIRA